MTSTYSDYTSVGKVPGWALLSSRCVLVIILLGGRRSVLVVPFSTLIWNFQNMV